MDKVSNILENNTSPSAGKNIVPDALKQKSILIAIVKPTPYNAGNLYFKRNVYINQ